MDDRSVLLSEAKKQSDALLKDLFGHAARESDKLFKHGVEWIHFKLELSLEPLGKVLIEADVGGPNPNRPSAQIRSGAAVPAELPEVAGRNYSASEVQDMVKARLRDCSYNDHANHAPILDMSKIVIDWCDKAKANPTGDELGVLLDPGNTPSPTRRHAAGDAETATPSGAEVDG